MKTFCWVITYILIKDQNKSLFLCMTASEALKKLIDVCIDPILIKEDSINGPSEPRPSILGNVCATVHGLLRCRNYQSWSMASLVIRALNGKLGIFCHSPLFWGFFFFVLFL